MTDAGIPMGEGRDVPRWLCPSCFYGVADPVVNGRGRCPCTPREQELIDQAERPDPKVLSDRLAQFLAPEACLNGTPMVPLHRSTIYRIVRALDAADTPPPAADGDREANTIDPKVAARDLVLNSNRVSEILNKPIKMDLSDTEHAQLDRLENEVTELRHFVRRQLLEHFGVTWEELEQAL